jgi:hypothetical protein
MWLIDTRRLVLCAFVEPPPYAILSHRWEDKEITFEMMQQLGHDEVEEQPETQFHLREGQLRKSAGGLKIINACKHARHERLEWIWIDTCCIDRTSSAELSEAINSMYRWYKESQVCYAFLADTQWLESDWFDRGWTLQELLAPGRVEFYDASWDLLGTRVSLASALSNRTAIDLELLRGTPSSMLSRYSVAQRMAWAAHRKTTRVEDRAYSLLGLFDVNMPLIYGEGERAFERLQEQIIRTSDDQTILAWNRCETSSDAGPFQPLLAPRPDCFAGHEDLVAIRDPEQPRTSFSLEKSGLMISMPYIAESEIGVLACGALGSPCQIGISLRANPAMDNTFTCLARETTILAMDSHHKAKQIDMIITRQHVPRPQTMASINQPYLYAWFMQAKASAWTEKIATYPLRMFSHQPKEAWDEKLSMFCLNSWQMQSAGAVFTYYVHQQHMIHNRWRQTFAVNVCFALCRPDTSQNWELLEASLIRNSAISVNYGEDRSIDEARKILMDELVARRPNSPDLDHSVQLKLRGFDKPTNLSVRMEWKLISAMPTLEISMKIVPLAG